MNAKTIENIFHSTFDLPQDQQNEDPQQLLFYKRSNICSSPAAMAMKNNIFTLIFYVNNVVRKQFNFLIFCVNNVMSI